MSMPRILWFVTAALVLAVPHPAPAQMTDPKACASHEQVQPGIHGAQPKTEGSGNLSDKLARTDGVLCPPNVDPDIKAAPPQNGGRMPVIPPPGAPGGDPSVQPK